MQPQSSEPASLAACIGATVVLDTAGPIVYLGVLESVAADGFWLRDVDVHDCRDGHAGKELYVCEARASGIRANRRRVLVLRESVMSISRLDDVLLD